jgi:hypothetical protein
MKLTVKILFLFILSITVHSAFSGKITHIYRLHEPVIQSSGGYDLVYFINSMLLGEAGRATLPFCSIELLLPPGEVAASVEIIYQDEFIVPGRYRLLPRQAPRPVSAGPAQERVFDSVFYNSSSRYPEELNNPVQTHFMNGFGIAVSSFTPVRYIPASGVISYFSEVTVIVHTMPDPAAGERSKLYNPSPEIISKVKDLVHNPSGIIQYPPVRSGTAGPYDCLVITTSQFRPEFDTLVDYYRARGYETRVATLEHIDSVMSGPDQQERIRNFIIGEYEGHGIGYVLIGGDAPVVPYRGFYCYVQSGGGYTDYGIPSDLYYSALDGSWNNDGDNMWAEPDEDDLYPELAIGRLTFSDTAELHNMLHKTFSYQASPVTGELTKSVLAGEHLWSNPETWGSDYLRLLIGFHSDNGYSTQGIPGNHPIDSLFDENSYWSKYDLMNEINSGQPWVHHVGHANYDYNMKMTNSDITNSNFASTNGTTHNYCIVYSHGCNCGGYDFTDCIAERMVGIDNFAVAFVGNSRFGWFNEGTTDGPSQHLHREFLDAVYRDSIFHAGAALTRSKAETAPFVEAGGQWEPGAIRWCFYDNYLLGDPLMAMWTREPLGVSAAYTRMIPAGTDSLVVMLSGPAGSYEDFRCSVLFNDTLAGYGMTDSTGTAVIETAGLNACGEASVVVTGYNILPHSFPLDISDLWLGYTSDWNHPGNWLSGSVPSPNTCVIVPTEPVGSNFPITNSSGTRQCKTILVEPGVNFRVGPGETFFITGN